MGMPRNDDDHHHKDQLTHLADCPRWRTELLDWFENKAPSLAAPYRGAVILLEHREFPGRVHFIAHAVRDIADRLLFIVDPTQKPSRVSYENHLDNIPWIELDDFKAGVSSVPVEEHLIPIRTARQIDALFKEHRQRRTPAGSYELLFRALLKLEPLHSVSHRRLAAAFNENRKWFMARAHIPIEVAELDEAELRTRFEAFERILHSFLGSFFTGTSELDEILQQANKQPS